jgi:tetratricopeptide (TPR) repeat protein/2-polyprenyl-3-methyl-5-hydroxy-6-metoxy-1,4-benzoquinol methylase
VKIENLIIQNKFDLALNNYKKNNLKVAEKLFKEILETKPNHLETICYLGTLFAQIKKLNLAKTLFYKAIKINPNNPSINNNLGNIFFELGESQKSLSFYEKAVKLKPDFFQAHYNLGIIFNNLGKYEKAINCFEKVIKYQPDDIKSYNILGKILKELGEYKKAFSYYEKSIKINPNNIVTINSILDFFTSIKLSELNKINIESIKKLIIFLFKKKINHNGIFHKAKLLIFSNENKNKVEEVINSDSSLLNNEIIQKVLKEEMFLLMLQNCFIRDIFLEKLLTKLRKEILFSLENSKTNILNEYFNFIISLAEQSFLNEYVFFQSEEEINYIKNLEKKILNNKEINEQEITILGCYLPLKNLESIKNKLLNYNSKNFLINKMIEMQINEPLKEIALKNSIKSIKIISDEISKKVRDQYEENPYPRWRYANVVSTDNFLVQLNNDIKPNNIELNNKFFNPNVLIAGCGTGQHLIHVIGYQNSNIVGVDLSRTSLAYAKRKIEETGYKNVEFLQGDILDLKNLNRKFDVIECGGVLHHMKEPLKGLKVLLELLEPHGFLKLGLYSEISRKHLASVREFIKKKKFKNSVKDIRDCRNAIINQNEDQLLHKVIQNNDFYSTSGTRDLIFHVQEHRFTIPEISKILNDFDLEFLGFTNPYFKKEFLQSFPDDRKNLSLDNWNQFEINNPKAFVGMYQFWVRKIKKT